VQRNFDLRKLELGTCGRPYGSPCKHEDIRCPMMRIDPQQRPRLITIIRNLGDRIAEARQNGWLGEVEGLQISLDAARAKLVSLDRAKPTPVANTTNLGKPVHPRTLNKSTNLPQHGISSPARTLLVLFPSSGFCPVKSDR